MTAVGMWERWMRSSVERAVRMQPKRVRKVADEYLYAAPGAREEIEEIRAACRRLVETGLTSSSLGRVAIRRTAHAVTQVAPGTDLNAVDARHLETADRSGADPVVEAAAACGAAALAHPSSLMALAAVGRTPERTLKALADQAGPIEIVDRPDPGTEGVWVVPSLGAIAVAGDIGGAVTRLEAAERLAQITLAGKE
jgi:ribulose-5-phosphate 4-epimerase/fuculose-1-phosphate aldolase